MKKHKKIKVFFGVLGLVIIPIYSIIFAINGDLINMTFSQIGGRVEGKFWNLIIWGALCSLFFYTIIQYIMLLIKNKSKLVTIAIVLSCLSLMFTVFLPFNHSMFPLASKLHNEIARIAIIFIVFSMYIFAFSIRKVDKKLCIRSMILLNICIALLVILFVYYGVSSIFEVLFSSIICFYLFAVLLIVEKSSFVNVEETIEEIENNKNEDFS